MFPIPTKNVGKKEGVCRTEFTVILKKFLHEMLKKKEVGFRTEFTIASYKTFPDIGKYNFSFKNMS